MCKASHITKMDVIKITKSNCTFAGKDLHFWVDRLSRNQSNRNCLKNVVNFPCNQNVVKSIYLKVAM